MKNLLNVKATDIIIALSFFALSVAVVLLVKSTKYDSAVAVAAIMVSIVIPFATKNLELEKHQQQFLFEKKYNAYSKYFKICDNFWKLSSQTIFNMHLFNTEKYETKEDFETQKAKVLQLYQEYMKIRDFLTMPGLEILIFINDDIDKKIKEIIEVDVDKNSTFDSKADLEENIKKASRYIQLISELAALLKKDLGIEVK